MRGNSNLVPRCFYSPDTRDLVPVLFSFNLCGSYTIFEKTVFNVNHSVWLICNCFKDYFLGLWSLLHSTAKEKQERAGERADHMQQRGPGWNQTLASAVKTQPWYMGLPSR